MFLSNTSSTIPVEVVLARARDDCRCPLAGKKLPDLPRFELRDAMQGPKVKQAAAERPFLDLFSRHTKNTRRKLRDAVYRHIGPISPLSRECSAEIKFVGRAIVEENLAKTDFRRRKSCKE